MGVDHRLLKTSENFKGLDLRSSDIMRSQEYSTDMRNAEYRISGAINKRKGFTNKRDAGFIKGMTTFKNISSNGSVTDELIYVENTDVKKEVSFNMVAYRNNIVTTPPISLTFQKTDSDINITSVDSSVGTEYFNKTFTSSDNILEFTNNWKYKTTFSSNTPIIDWDNLDPDTTRIHWDDFDHRFRELDGASDVMHIFVPISAINIPALEEYLNLTSLHETEVNRYNTSSSFDNDLFKFMGRNILKNKTIGTNQTSNSMTWVNVTNQAIDGQINSYTTLTNSTGATHLRLNFTLLNDNISTGSLSFQLKTYAVIGDSLNFNHGYDWNNFAIFFTFACADFTIEQQDFNYQSYPSPGGPIEKSNIFFSISFTNFRQNFLTNVENYNGTFDYPYILPSIPGTMEEFTANYDLSDMFSCGPSISLINLELRNNDNDSVSQFLVESVMSLDNNTIEISNNAVSTFPTIVTTGYINESVGTLSWTSDDYEYILTENVNFASLNNLLYISNGIDDLLKYDGESVYRAGLPNCSKDIATFSFNTTSTNYLHDVKPGQVEYFTFNDTDYSNNNSLPETLPADTKYMFKFNSGGFYRKSAAVSGSYGSYSTLQLYSTFSSGTVVSGTDLEIEVITDSVGGIKNYYTINKGKNYKGQDSNGAGGDSIGITKAIFTGVSTDNTLVYGDLDIVDVSSAVRDRTYEYRFAYEYTDYKGNIISSQPSDPVKLVVGSARSVNITFPLTISDLSTFKTDGIFDTAWQSSNGVTFPTTLTDTNYPIEKLDGENRLRILVYRSKGYSPIAGEVVGQYYKIADLEYVAGGTEDNQGTFLPTTFTDTYHDEPNDAEAATQYDPVINPFLAFVEPIKRKDPPPKGKYLTVFKNCLVIAGQNDNVNNVQYSLPKNFTTGEIGSEYFPDDDNGIVVESPFGSKITAISALRDALFVFHKDSIFSVTGNINQLELPSVNLITKEGGVGCTSQASIEEFKGGLAFVSHTGVFSISNQGLSEISEIIKPLFLQDNFIKEKAISYNWTDRNLLLICIPDYIVQGDQEYNIIDDTMDAYISKDSLILAFDYYRGAWLRWDTIEFTNGIAEVDGVLNFAQLTNTTNTLATINNQGDTDDYNDNGKPINFVYETNWESLGDPTTPKKFLRLKVHSFDTDGVFESPGFLLEAGIQKNYQNYNEGKITFDFGAVTGGGWGNFAWGDDSWGSLPSQYLKSKLPTGKARSFKIRFANNENNENVLITNYELEIAAPYRSEIKE